MRDMANKMAELKFEAPLAQFEETDDWSSSTGDFQTALSIHNKKSNEDELNYNRKISRKELMEDTAELLLMNEFNEDCQLLLTDNSNNMLGDILGPPATNRRSNDETDNFTETFSGSLEDLVNTFDEKITKCFGNYEESVEKLAPVQVRTQEEIMNECQMWWTITGNFGNILPIDWSKSYARKIHMPALNLNENKEPLSPDDDLELLSSEDEAVASDLDMHALILGGLHPEPEPLKTADEVIREIDDMIMQEDMASSMTDDQSPDDSDRHSHHHHHHHRASHEALEKAKEVLSTPLYEDKLRDLSLSQLNELYMELEVLIREFSETLIAELAHRDELEYEKELKNTFISLLLAVQNKRRQYHVEKKRSNKGGHALRAPSTGLDPKYLTTVIPYHLDSGPPQNQSLQVLIKILKAINEDSPTVPTLLTDYILKDNLIHNPSALKSATTRIMLHFPPNTTTQDEIIDLLDMTTAYNNPHTSIGWRYSMRRNMQEIIPGLFLGPYLSALKTCRPALRTNGITHIVCVRQDIEAHYIKPQFNDFTYLTLDIADMVTESIIRFFPTVRSFIDDALSESGKVLVHGNNGNSRSATLVLAYIMEKYGINYREAIELVKERRACIKPNDGFVAQLAEYEPIYRARQTLTMGEGSTSSLGAAVRQRRKRKSEQLTETTTGGGGDLIQPPSSPVSPPIDRPDPPHYYSAAEISPGDVTTQQYQQQHLSMEVHDISNHLHRLWMLKSA